MRIRSFRFALSLLAAALVLGGCRDEIQVTVSPEAVTAVAGEIVTFTGDATGADDPRVGWSVSEGTIDPEGRYKVPLKAGTYEVTAWSVEDRARVAIAKVTVPRAPTVSIYPETLTLQAGASHTFVAMTHDVADRSVEWVLNPSSPEPFFQLSHNHSFHAPSQPGTYQLVARSAMAPEATATATITVTTEPQPSVNLTQQWDVTSTYAGSFMKLDGHAWDGSKQTSPLWSVDGPGGITSGGLYLVPEEPGISYVRGAAPSSPSRDALLAITAKKPDALPVVSIAPNYNLFMRPGSQQSFVARVFGAEDREVLWSIREPDGGTITQDGVYTAPAVSEFKTFHALATSKANPSRSAEVTVMVSSVTNDRSVVITPNVLKLPRGGSARLSAKVTGGIGLAVAFWRVVSTGGGTITQDGTYTAPNTPGTYFVAAEASGNTDTLARITVE